MVDKYFTLTSAEKANAIERIAGEFEQIASIKFAFLHGSFIEKSYYRDIGESTVSCWLLSVAAKRERNLQR